MLPRLRTAIVSALLFGGTLLLYSRAIGFGFINYDDPSYVTANPHVQGGLSWAGLRWAFTARADYWHPLAWLSHMLDWQLYGPFASGHHLTSVLWHALNAVLAFLVFRRLAGGFWRSAFAAALFAWHPLRVESVVWITERKDVMSGCFFLLTLLAYAHYVDVRKSGRPAWRSYLLTFACFAVGLMCKPMLVTLPLVLLVLDFWPFGRGTSPVAWRHLVVEKLPFFVLSGAASAATLLMQRNAGALVFTLPFAARAGNAEVSLARYLGKFVWPFNLVVCYPHPGYWPVLVIACTAALLAGLVALAWSQRRTRPWIAAGLAWYLVALLPVLGLVQAGFQSMADRYTYLPLLGIELALIWSIPNWIGRLGRVAGAVVAGALLVACAARTWNQEGVWQNSVSLFEHAVRVSDRNDVAQGFLASALFDAGHFNEAVMHAELARALNPSNDQALVMLAGLREKQGNVKEAMSLYRSALALRPDNPLVQCQLGFLEMNSGHLDRARALMTHALREDPTLRARTLQIGSTALQHGDAASALFLYNLVLSVDPDNPEANAGAGFALLARGDAAGAVVHLRTAVEHAPGLADAQLALAYCAEQLARPAEVSAALTHAEEAAPNNPVILARVADFHARLNDFTAAIRLYRRVVALAPSDINAHVALGFLLVHEGDRVGGIAQWRRALELDPKLIELRNRLIQEESLPSSAP